VGAGKANLKNEPEEVFSVAANVDRDLETPPDLPGVYYAVKIVYPFFVALK